MNQMIDAIFTGKPERCAETMLPDAGGKIGRDANIQGAISLTGEDVRARLARLHDAYYAAPWTLKQVQGDGLGSVTQ